MNSNSLAIRFNMSGVTAEGMEKSWHTWVSKQSAMCTNPSDAESMQEKQNQIVNQSRFFPSPSELSLRAVNSKHLLQLNTSERTLGLQVMLTSAGSFY